MLRRHRGEAARAARLQGLRALLITGWPFGELTTIAAGLVLGASLVMGIPMVFGPNGYIDPYGYPQFDEPETVFQMALSGLSIIGPLLIGAFLIIRALRQRR